MHSLLNLYIEIPYALHYCVIHYMDVHYIFHTYFHSESHHTVANKGINKTILPTADMDLLRGRLHMDYVFYNDIYERFIQLYNNVRQTCTVERLAK